MLILSKWDKAAEAQQDINVSFRFSTLASWPTFLPFCPAKSAKKNAPSETTHGSISVKERARERLIICELANGLSAGVITRHTRSSPTWCTQKKHKCWFHLSWSALAVSMRVLYALSLSKFQKFNSGPEGNSPTRIQRQKRSIVPPELWPYHFLVVLFVCSVLKRNKFRKYEYHKQIKLQENDEKLPELLEDSNCSNYKCHWQEAVFRFKDVWASKNTKVLKSENHCNRTFPGISGSCWSVFFW